MYDQLIEKLESLTGPDREADAAIARFLGYEVTDAFNKSEDRPQTGIGLLYRLPGERYKRIIPRFTGSIDAALTLGRNEKERYFILEAIQRHYNKPDTTIAESIPKGCVEAIETRELIQ